MTLLGEDMGKWVFLLVYQEQASVYQIKNVISEHP